MNQTFFKRMFLVGALWNLLGGAFIIFATDWIFSNTGLTPPVPPLYYQAWIALFLTFGIGYWIVSRDPYPNRNIALLGMIGKLAFSVVFVYNWLAYPGQVPRFFLIPVVGDLIFALLFGLYLRQARPA